MTKTARTATEVFVTFRGFDAEPALEALVREQAERLSRFCDRILTCRVAVEQLEHRRGRPYHVRIDLRLPGEEIVVSRRPSLHATLVRGDDTETKQDEIDAPNREASFAVSQAFRAAQRRLQDSMRRHQGAVKLHESQSHAMVVGRENAG